MHHRLGLQAALTAQAEAMWRRPRPCGAGGPDWDRYDDDSLHPFAALIPPPPPQSIISGARLRC
eukprot:scaffold5735_cov56-Isochrysis_galbana.AAC.1